MKKIDLYFLVLVLVLFLPFFLSGELYTGYKSMNGAHPYFIGFLKFAILATMGESIGLRLREGIYNKPGFGLVPRSIVWGFLGLTIVMAFKIFGAGVLLQRLDQRQADVAEQVAFVKLVE